MPNYKVLYNPHAANGRGEENARRLQTLLEGASLEFQNITKIYDYAAFLRQFPRMELLSYPVETGH